MTLIKQGKIDMHFLAFLKSAIWVTLWYLPKAKFYTVCSEKTAVALKSKVGELFFVKL